MEEKTWYIKCPYCDKEIPVKITSEGKAIPQIDYTEIKKESTNA